MGRHKQQEQTTADAQPESLTELEPVIHEFVNKLNALEHEEETLREQKKELVDSYADRLDTKTLKLALRQAALLKKVERKDTFEKFCEVLSRE